VREEGADEARVGRHPRGAALEGVETEEGPVALVAAGVGERAEVREAQREAERHDRREREGPRPVRTQGGHRARRKIQVSAPMERCMRTQRSGAGSSHFERRAQA
jgi:hypothetical protein